MLGDTLHAALNYVGVTSERVQHWLGEPCNCEERRQKLNDLDNWARRTLKTYSTKSLDYLKDILES